MTRVSAPRDHSLDALRAAMMLLGVVLHSAASYTVNAERTPWPYQDAQTTVGFDLLVFTIHIFRMPVFFLVAGFFGPSSTTATAPGRSSATASTACFCR